MFSRLCDFSIVNLILEYSESLIKTIQEKTQKKEMYIGLVEVCVQLKSLFNLDIFILNIFFKE